jgi:hypothetical protein
MIRLEIDGRSIMSLDIIRYTPEYQMLDGEATDRTRAPGWEMIREPQGIIVNFEIEIFRGTRVSNPDFVFLLETFYRLGSEEYVTVTHTDMIGKIWEQEMYYVVTGVNIGIIGNVLETSSNTTVSFVAKKGSGYAV